MFNLNLKPRRPADRELPTGCLPALLLAGVVAAAVALVLVAVGGRVWWGGG